MCECADYRCADVFSSICIFCFRPVFRYKKDVPCFQLNRDMKNLIPLVCILLLLSCGSKPHKPNNEIIRVELARCCAWFDSGATISIDSSLNYKYYGDYSNVKRGYFTGKISSTYWDTLKRKLENANFKTIPPNSKLVMLDAGYFEFIIYLERLAKENNKVLGWGQRTNSESI